MSEGGVCVIPPKRRRPQLTINAPVRLPTIVYTPITMEEDFASEILDGLYLGSVNDALNISQLNSRGIVRIVNAAQECDYEHMLMDVLKLNLRDHSSEPIATYFEETFRFIDEARSQNQGVLVHCKRGISRSAAIVIAYVMKKLQISYDKAFDLVKEKRSCINPNIRFIIALENY